jgi:cytochrome c oxidase subunit IV
MSTNTKTHHILPLSVYLTVGAILLTLTLVTVWVAEQDFGSFNLIVAMAIAAVKATLVALYFMHLKYDSKVYLAVFVGALLFLAVFITLTMFDTERRDDIYEIQGESIQKNAVIYQPPTADTAHATPAVKPDSTARVAPATK